MIEVVSLMNAEGLTVDRATNLVRNFVEFAPLGTVLVALLGVGVAERSGWLTAVIRGNGAQCAAQPRHGHHRLWRACSRTRPPRWATSYSCHSPQSSSTRSAAIRLAGLAAAFAGVSGGYSANLLIGTVDPLLSGITTEAARLIDPGYEVDVSANWYFMIASTFLITAVGSFISLKIVEPSLGKYEGTPEGLDDEDDSHRMDPLSAEEEDGASGTRFGRRSCSSAS